MNFRAEITITEDVANVQRLLEAEDAQTNNKRSSFKLKNKDDKLLIQIEAKDSVALRAIMNTVTKILTVYEKTRGSIK